MGGGRLAVDRERWERAQAWELAFWRGAQRKTGARRIIYPLVRPLLVALESKRATGDDWNLWWRRQLESYRFLPVNLGDVIELGCGPYTNVRLILRGRTARRVVCSDPLAGEYVTFRHRWLARAARKGWVEIDTHPIEECPFPPGSFDVVVLINVLDHVMDAEVCLRTAVELVRPGGYLIFGQDLSEREGTRPTWFDEGHPIRLTIGDVSPVLQQFDLLVQKVLSREESRDPRTQAGVWVFAGKRRAQAGT
jgi:SAM-dependent methyltransferase